jgi:2-phosphosulfolactate phosphatase
MTPFDPRECACRCEWGIAGVDVLSFSTCVGVAIGRGAAILPYPWRLRVSPPRP